MIIISVGIAIYRKIKRRLMRKEKECLELGYALLSIFLLGKITINKLNANIKLHDYDYQHHFIYVLLFLKAIYLIQHQTCQSSPQIRVTTDSETEKYTALKDPKKEKQLIEVYFS